VPSADTPTGEDGGNDDDDDNLALDAKGGVSSP